MNHAARAGRLPSIPAASVPQRLLEALSSWDIVLACCYCERVRDPDLAWHLLPTLPSGQVTARLSHGICPECWETVVVEEYGCDLSYSLTTAPIA